MNKTDRNYAIIDKEVLSFVFEVTNCYQYLDGKRLKLIQIINI